MTFNEFSKWSLAVRSQGWLGLILRMTGKPSPQYYQNLHLVGPGLMLVMVKMEKRQRLWQGKLEKTLLLTLGKDETPTASLACLGTDTGENWTAEGQLCVLLP
jgi:hypothetical protein